MQWPLILDPSSLTWLHSGNLKVIHWASSVQVLFSYRLSLPKAWSFGQFLSHQRNFPRNCLTPCPLSLSTFSSGRKRAGSSVSFPAQMYTTRYFWSFSLWVLCIRTCYCTWHVVDYQRKFLIPFCSCIFASCHLSVSQCMSFLAFVFLCVPDWSCNGNDYLIFNYIWYSETLLISFNYLCQIISYT